MVTDKELTDRIVAVLDSMDECEFLELANNYLGTDYAYDDIQWNTCGK